MNNCLNIAVIPQFRETCWFNAILMSCFYSQGLRKLMINKKKDNLSKFIRQIIKNSYNKENLKLFNKIKPEILLLNILNKNNPNMKKIITNKKAFNWNFNYISEFLQYYGVSVLNVTCTNNKFILNFFKTSIYYELKILDIYHNFEVDVDADIKEINDDPDVLLFNLTNKTIYKELMKIYPELEKLDSKNFDNIHFEKLDETIEFNGQIYKLDSILINNYNNFDIKKAHSIVGITCENKKYVYNGWNSLTIDASMITKDKIQSYPCSLIEYNWDIKKDKEFCLNPFECKLKGMDKKDLCFSFDKGERILVYVKVDNDETRRLSSSSFKNFSSKSINEIKEDLKDFFDYQTQKDVEEQLNLFGLRYNPILSLNINKKILLYAIYDDYNIPHSHIIDDIQQEYYPFDETNNKNLFFHYFIKDVENTYKNLMKDKTNVRLRDIYNSQIDIRKIVEIFKLDLAELKREFSKVFNELFKYYKISANDKFIYIHRDIIIKLFKLDFFIPYLIGYKTKVSDIDDLNIYLLRDNTKEKNKIIDLFNHLKITPKVTTIEGLLVNMNDLYKKL